MISSRQYHIYAVALVIMCMCLSCRQELCYDHYPSMDVRFSWEQEWERDYGMNLKDTWDSNLHLYGYDELRPDVPEWVHMVIHTKDGHFSERFLMPEGAKFEVDEDEDYSILCYNGDTEYIILSDVASISDMRASATTRTRATSALQQMQELYHDTRTTNPPDVIYSAHIEHVGGVMNHEVRNLPIKMQPLVYTYLITFEFEHGLEYVSVARGALGGVAEGVYLRSGVTTDETSIILFDCNLFSGGCRSKVRSFGIPGFPDSYFGRSGSEAPGRTPFYLNLEVKLTNGNTLNFNYDISDQMKNQPRGGVITVKGVRVEDNEGSAGTSSSGFQVDIVGWDDEGEEIDIPLG